MADFPLHVALVLAPSDELVAPRKQQILAGAGTAEAHNTTPLGVGKQATLQVSSLTSVRVAFRAAPALSTVVSASNMRLPAGARFDWDVSDNDKHVYVEASDGVTAYEAAVWTSSP